MLFVFVGMLLNHSVLAAENSTPANDKLIFGIAPFMSPLALIKRMAPLRNYLTQTLGTDVIIETATDAREFAKRTLNGRYDFVLTNPTFSLMAMDTGHFQIVASQKNKLSGYFIALKDSPFNSINDLDGTKVGAPPEVGFMGQLIAPYLKSIDFAVTQPEIIYFNSHNAAVAALRIGDTDATLIVSFMEKHLRKKGLDFKILHKTDEFPGMTILAQQNLTPQMTKKLQLSLFELDSNEQGKQVLSKISMSGYQELDIKELEKVRPYLPAKTMQ